MKHRFSIYCHTNAVNGKRYVGQTVDTVEGRWGEHVSAAKRGRGSRILGAAIQKYGVDAFTHELLDVVTTQEGADAAERAWIGQRRTLSPNGYNLSYGGGGPGYHHEESKRLIAESSRNRFRKMTPEQREAFFKKTLHVWTPERRLRAKELLKSEEFRKKLVDGQKSFWSQFTPEEKSDRVKHQLAGISKSQKSESVKKAWANMSPEARGARVRKAGAASAVSDVNRVERARAWQNEQARTRTPEQRSAIVLKSWETRRSRKNKQQ